MIISQLPIVMLRSLICTIVIEVVIGIICGIRNKKDLLNVLLVNVLTNPIVVSLPFLFLLRFGPKGMKIVLLTLEILTVIGEGFVYKKVLDYKKINPFLLSLILNLGSYFIGEVINKVWIL